MRAQENIKAINHNIYYNQYIIIQYNNLKNLQMIIRRTVGTHKYIYT